MIKLNLEMYFTVAGNGEYLVV